MNKKPIRKSPSFALLIAPMLLLTNPAQAHANLTNGSFEDGFSNWTTTGKTTIEDANFGLAPVNGTYQAVLETLQDETGNNSSDLETFLGLSSGSLTALGAVEGSAIKRTINVKAGDRLSFSWNFLTDQEPGDPNYNDFAFLSLGSINQLADTNSVSSLSFSRLAQQTGYQSYTYNFATAGTYLLGFGVVDVGDNAVNSALVVDDVQITPVPEPTTIFGLLMSAGFGYAGKIRFSQQRKKTKLK